MAPPRLARTLWLATPMMRGDDVRTLQDRLRTVAGEPIAPDGLFGQGTEAAVLRFQHAATLQEDGVVGHDTWSRLFPGAPDTPDTPAPDRADALRTPHRAYADGCTWSCSEAGVAIAGMTDALRPTPADTALVRAVVLQHGAALKAVLAATPLPLELVVATVCTESGGRADARRMEPGCDRLAPERTPTRVSWGLMQTLLATARGALRQPGLPLAALLVPETSIRAGVAVMMRNARSTGFDPPLVAAAYNAGSLRRNDGAANHWKLLQYPPGTAQHVDRFCRFFNAAVAADIGLAGVTRFRDTLAGTTPARPATPAPAPMLDSAPAVTPDPPDPDALIPAQLEAALAKAGRFPGPPGDPAALAAALGRAFDAEALAGHLLQGWETWPEPRRRLAAEQSVIKAAGIDPGDLDGLLGPQTQFARESFQHLARTGTPLLLPDRDRVPATAEPDTPAASRWPRQADVERTFGEKGAHQTLLVPPYRMRAAENLALPVTRFRCHEKVHDAFLRVFQKTLSEYGEQRIAELRLDVFGGCLNVRLMRGGTQWSMHSWGIAIDLDPVRNTLTMHKDRAAFARPEYEPFWRIVEGEGLVSLGRQRDYDWMHFQAARF